LQPEVGMINLLYISHSSYRGGAEVALLTLLKFLDRSTITPLVVIPHEGYLSGELEKIGVPWLLLEIPWWLRGPWLAEPHSLLGPSWSGDFASLDLMELLHLTDNAVQRRLKRLVEIIKDNEIHIVHTNTFPILEGALAAGIAGVRHVWHLHEVDDGHPSLLPRLPAMARYWMLDAFSDTVVVPSDYARKFYTPHVAADRLSLIYTGVESDLGHLGLSDPGRADIRQQCRKELGLAQEHLVICSVGSADRVKGWLDLVATADRLLKGWKELRFIVVGDTGRDTFPEVQAQVQRLGLAGKIIFTGHSVDAQKIMLASDVVFQPSRLENLSLVNIEGMALSQPVVATRCGGTDEVVRHQETGFLVPIGDHGAMIQALAALLDNPGMRRRFGEAGRQMYLEKFTPDLYAQKFMELYQGLMETDKPSASPDQAALAALASLYAGLLGIVMQSEHTRQRLDDIIGSRSYQFTVRLRKLWKTIRIKKPPGGPHT
jgi:glycosyltransferase involved in cell wall biosynthesis